MQSLGASQQTGMAGDEEAGQLLGTTSTGTSEPDTQVASKQGDHKAASRALQAGHIDEFATVETLQGPISAYIVFRSLESASEVQAACRPALVCPCRSAAAQATPQSAFPSDAPAGLPLPFNLGAERLGV